MLFVYPRYLFQRYLEAFGKYVRIISQYDKPIEEVKITRTSLSRSPKVLGKPVVFMTE